MVKFIVVDDNSEFQNIICKVIDNTMFKTEEYYIENTINTCDLHKAIVDCSTQKFIF